MCIIIDIATEWVIELSFSHIITWIIISPRSLDIFSWAVSINFGFEIIFYWSVPFIQHLSTFVDLS